jgi:hypothetical protein
MTKYKWQLAKPHPSVHQLLRNAVLRNPIKRLTITTLLGHSVCNKIHVTDCGFSRWLIVDINSILRLLKRVRSDDGGGMFR